MTQREFIKRLEELLQGISSEEREAALLYYEDYFQDAGPEYAEQVIRELGSPEKVAATIIGDLNQVQEKNTDHIIYTENGYRDISVEEEPYEVVTGYAEKKEKDIDEEAKNANYQYIHEEAKNHGTNNKSKILLIVLLAIFAIPVGIPLVASGFGVIVGILGALLGIFIAIVVTSIAFLVSGFVLFFLGIVQLFITASNGILMCGVGLILFGVGTLGTMITIYFSSTVIPAMIRGIASIFRKLFQRRSETV